MTVVIRLKKQIVALHDGIVYIFSVEALKGICAIPKEKNTKSNIGRQVVGFCIDPDDFKRYEVFKDSRFVELLLCKHTHISTNEKTGVTECPDCGAMKQKNGEWNNEEKTIITQEQLNHLEDRDAKLEALEAGGVDNWEWYGESLKDYWKERE